MKLMLPTNWDPELIAQIAPFKPDYIYGSLPSEATLRSSQMLSDASEDDIAAPCFTSLRSKAFVSFTS